MTTTCPRCLRTLSTADPDGPPAFCMFCGQKLRDTHETTPAPDGMPALAGLRTATHLPSHEADDAPEPAPTDVGGYHLTRLLGAGGMGMVFEAESPDGSRVAVKLLSSRLSSSPTLVERFKQEGRLASQLSHPRCVFVLAADTDAGRPYIVMELMPGRTLKDVIDRDGPLPPDRAVEYILDVIDGLAEAHRIGMIHRDVKPSNCFLTADDRVKVGDFGLSKSLAGTGEHHLTQTGTFLGTVLFASPEQIRGEPLDYASDVYSVCATLYYLLVGEAPYHHESVTAALAKAISEPPPPICPRRPEVSRALEKVVLRGLERDRGRRWQTLDDLRDALAHLLPARQAPARPRVMIGAYVLDRIALAFLAGPAEMLRQLLTGSHQLHYDPAEFRWLPVLILLAYFVVGEGAFGATPGKWLLGLRVSRVGRTGPPGLGRAFVRVGVFNLLLFGVFLIPGWLLELHERSVTGPAAVAVFGLSVTGLLWQFRRSAHGYRGVHDFASGCHVTQRPLPARKLRLLPLRPGPLDAEPPAPAESLPEAVGGYAVRGRVWAEPSGEQVWAAEDKALGRKVLLWLRPTDSGGVISPVEVSRPTRLRRLGGGLLHWSGREFDWTAFAAPVGAPLADTIRPDRPLPWADARFLLEQLADEFRAAEADGSLPPELSLGQVWVEPNGRVQLIDFPMPEAEDAPPATTEPLVLLRQVASLTLEGRPRSGPFAPSRRGRVFTGVHAPVPPHAAPILTRLFDPGGYQSLDELHRDLAETHSHPPEVTPAVRAAQLGIQATLLGPGLLLLFGVTGFTAVMLAWLAAERAAEADAVLTGLRDPEKRAELLKLKEAEPAAKNPRPVEARLEGLRDRKRDEADRRRTALLAPQRFLLDQLPPPADEFDHVPPRTVRDLLTWAGTAEKSRAGRADSPWGTEAGQVWATVVILPLAWVTAAAVLRGGLSMLLAGVALVRADGRKAGRRQCALRAALVWLPVTALLAASLWLQVYYPGRVYLYAGLWLLAVVLLPVYVVVALRNPDRPPQDRLAGTFLVPA